MRRGSVGRRRPFSTDKPAPKSFGAAETSQTAGVVTVCQHWPCASTFVRFTHVPLHSRCAIKRNCLAAKGANGTCANQTPENYEPDFRNHGWNGCDDAGDVHLHGIRASLYAKVVPSLALILSGRKVRLPDGRVVGFRYVKGGGTFDLPVG